MLVWTLSHLINRRRGRFVHQHYLVLLAILWLGLDYVVVDLSGQPYYAYYLQLVLPFCFASAFLLSAVEHWLVRQYNRYRENLGKGWPRVLTPNLELTTVFVAFTLWSNFTVLRAMGDNFSLGLAGLVSPPQAVQQLDQTSQLAAILQVSAYLKDVARVDAATSLYVWGDAPQIYFLTGTHSPTRFYYNLPLLTIGYASPRLYQEFLQTLQAKPPQYLVDTGAPTYIDATTSVSGSGDALRTTEYKLDPQLLAALRAFLSSHYTLQTQFNLGQPNQMLLYRLKD